MKNNTISSEHGTVLIPGRTEGPVLISPDTFCFARLGPRSGIITDKRVSLFGQTIKEKILVILCHRGSTTSPAVFLETCRHKAGPLAILVRKSDSMLVFSVLLVKEFCNLTIPLMEGVDEKILGTLEPDSFVRGDTG